MTLAVCFGVKYKYENFPLLFLLLALEVPYHISFSTSRTYLQPATSLPLPSRDWADRKSADQRKS